MAFVIAFDATGATEPARVGGKAAGLGRLVARGFDLPVGFTLSTAVDAAFLTHQGLAARLHTLLAELPIDDAAALERRTAAKARE